MAEKQFDNVKVTVEFEETANRQQVATGDSLPTLFSKVKKFFTDLKTVAFSGSYNDLTDVPTSLPASDVSSWAKASTKPTYTASEVGADPAGTAVNAINALDVTDTAVSGKYVSSVSETNGKISVTRASLPDYSNTYDAKGSADTALASAKSYADTKDTATLNSAKSYTDSKIDAIVGEGAAETLDTIGEISSAIEENQDMIDTLNSAIGNKANASDLTSHTGNKSNPHSVTKAQVGLGNVENKTSATIRSEITSDNVTDALGYTPMEDVTVPISKGGTGATTAKGAEYNLLGNMSETTGAVSDSSLITGTYASPNNTNGVLYFRKASLFWDYIKSKISSILGLTATQYNGNSATATKATKAEALSNTAAIGSATNPVYINASGVPTKTTYTLGKSVPSDAEFTDTIYTEATESANGLMSAADKVKLNATNIGYGTCSTAAGTAAKVVTLIDNDNWKLDVGSTVIVKFSATNTAQNPTLNVNGTGAKSIWLNTALITTTALSYAGYANRPIKFVYDGTNYIFMGWSQDNNTTYTNASLGQGYGTCATAAATTAKVVTLSSYALTTGGIVAVKFTYAVPANATMNINSKGAKAIYYRGAAITANVIRDGDIGIFIYNGSQYHLLTVDRDADTTYTHPSHTAKSSGLYKVTVDSQGHVSAATAVTKADITALGIPASDTNTTYEKATSDTLGLVKIGYTESGKNYPVELNDSGQMFVNVPWTDNNTTYTLSSFGITATAAELNYMDGVTSNVQNQLDNKLSLSGGTVTGAFKLAHASSSTEGGQIDLLAPPTGNTYNGISIDTAKGLLRIFGIASADGTTKTGTGTVLSIDPYEKTITGGYTITGTVSNATSQSSAATSAPNTSYLRQIATGTNTATISNCPTGTLYGQYS